MSRAVVLGACGAIVLGAGGGGIDGAGADGAGDDGGGGDDDGGGGFQAGGANTDDHVGCSAAIRLAEGVAWPGTAWPVGEDG